MTSSNIILVKEFLSSLKEDQELDHLFPLLLNVMGFRIVQTAKESKGQSQYGKDIIAMGQASDGIMYRWYFEVKGFKDKDITDQNFSAPDGIRDSLIAAKDAPFIDSSICDFNDLPIKIVLVHNGVLRANTRPTFEGFISRTFSDTEFERWDINMLTQLFSDHLYGEYLFADNQSDHFYFLIHQTIHLMTFQI